MTTKTELLKDRTEMRTLVNKLNKLLKTKETCIHEHQKDFKRQLKIRRHIENQNQLIKQKNDQHEQHIVSLDLLVGQLTAKIEFSSLTNPFGAAQPYNHDLVPTKDVQLQPENEECLFDYMSDGTYRKIAFPDLKGDERFFCDEMNGCGEGVSNE